MFITFLYPDALSGTATSASAASCCGAVKSPSLIPFRSVAPDCKVDPVGRFDQFVRVFSVSSRRAFARCASFNVARKAFAAATAFATPPPDAAGFCARGATHSAATKMTTTKPRRCSFMGCLTLWKRG